MKVRKSGYRLLFIVLLMSILLNGINVSAKYSGVSFSDGEYESNIYEDLEVYLHVEDKNTIEKVTLEFEDDKIFNASKKEFGKNAIESAGNENGNIVKLYLQPMKMGKTNVSLNIDGKVVSKQKSKIVIVKPTKLINQALEFGKVIIPKTTTIGEYQIKKFSEYKNKNNILKKFNSKFKNDISKICKDSQMNCTKISDENVEQFKSNLNSLMFNGKYNKKQIIKMDSILTVYVNSINNKVIDSKIEELNNRNVLVKSSKVSEQNIKDTLTDIEALLPNNNAVKKVVDNEVNVRVRAFSDPKANAYALKYALKPNKASYAVIPNNDCANFVSQVIKAGGRSMTNTWKYNKSLGAKNHYSTYAWKHAGALKNYYGHAYTSKNFKNFSYNVFGATAIYYDYNEDGVPEHSAWVTQANSSYKTYTDQIGTKRTYMNFRVAQHTFNYLEWVSNNDNDWEMIDGRYYVSYFL